MSGIDGEDSDANWKHDSYERARQHIGPMFLVGMITFCAFLVGTAAAGFVEIPAIRVVGWPRVSRFNYVASLILYVVVAAAVSWLGAAVPLIVKGNMKARVALIHSVELSSGYEGALLLLVIESVAGSLLVWYGTRHGLAVLVPEHLKYTVSYNWFVNLVGVLASAALEPPLLIGFSLLGDSDLVRRSSSQDLEHATRISGVG